MDLRSRPLALVLATGLTAAACSNVDDGVTPAAVTVTPSSVAGAATIPATSTIVTTTSTAATATSIGDVADPGRATADTLGAPSPPFVTAALTGEPDSSGWPLPAGAWQSSMFDPSLKFVTTTDLRLISQSPEAIVMTEANADDDARLTILSPLAVGGDDNVPTAVPDDFETYLRSVDSIDITAVRKFARDDGVTMMEADFTAREPVGHTKFACSIGADCLWLMKTSAGEDVHVIEGSPIRIVATAIDGVPFRVVASASDRDAFDRLATEAHHIAASFATTTDRPPESSRNFLATLGTRARSIPPGIWVARVGDQVVEFHVASELDGFAIDHAGSNTILFDVGDIGYAYVAQPLGVVDPHAPQTVDGMAADDLIDPPPSVDEYETWLSQIVVVTGRTATTIGGSPATSWTTEIDDSVEHYTCGPPMRATTGGRCVSMFTTELGFWSSSDLDAGGISYYMDDLGTHVGGGPTDPDRAEEFERAILPLLESIRFVG